MFLLRNIQRLPCRAYCTFLTEAKTSSFGSQLPSPSFIPPPDTSGLIKFNSNNISLSFGILDTHRGIRKKEIIDIPLLPNKIVDNPVSIIKEIDEIREGIENIQLPDMVKGNVDDQGMRAQVKKDNRPLGIMIIRRKKMKKHKRRKLWKRMRFEWAKRRQRREYRKEKAFQAELLAQIAEAEKFSAEEYVADKIKKATDVPLPRYWKGKRLPAFIIKDLVEQDKIKRQTNLEKLERIEKYRNTKL